MENITDADYKHAKKVWKNFNLKNLGFYHDLSVQSNTLLLAAVFESFRNKCIRIYELDLAYFFICTRISMLILLKRDLYRIRIVI